MPESTSSSIATASEASAASQNASLSSNDASSQQPGMDVRCPGCRGPAVFSALNPWRPFCCQRCHELDLGAWASERYRLVSRSDELPPGVERRTLDDDRDD